MASRFAAALGGFDLSQADAAALGRVLGVARGVQARVDAVVVRVGLRADELAAHGACAPARDALLGEGRVRGSTARREAARAALASRSTELGRAMGSGLMGSDHLDALVRRLGRLDGDHLDRVDLSALLDRGDRLPADTFDAALRRAVDLAAPACGPSDDHTLDENEVARVGSEVRHWFDHRSGMGHLTARLDPERYEAVAAALDQHVNSLAAAAGAAGDEARHKNANLAAEALVDLVCASGQRHTHRPQVTVVVDHATLLHGRHSRTIAETGNGADLTDQAIARLCCDAVLRRVVHDGRGVPIDVGRRHRTATDAQWAALRSVHRSCAWAGCDRPLDHCQAHHLSYWEHGGPTDLDNLVPLCTHHHHLVHDGRWRIELLADRALRIIRPDGERHATTDRPTRRPPPLERV